MFNISAISLLIFGKFTRFVYGMQCHLLKIYSACKNEQMTPFTTHTQHFASVFGNFSGVKAAIFALIQAFSFSTVFCLVAYTLFLK